MNTSSTPDPRRPWKALAAAVVAGIAVAVSQGADILPPWALLILSIVSAGLATYLVPNPEAHRAQH